MKQDQFETVIPLRKVFEFPKTKRTRKAINEIKAFTQKHAKNVEVQISAEVNRHIQLNSRRIPRKINAVLVKKDNKVKVYLQGGKELKEDQKMDAQEKEKKKKEEKDSKKTDEKKETAKEQEDQKEKLEDKREKEKAAKSLEMKGRA